MNALERQAQQTRPRLLQAQRAMGFPAFDKIKRCPPDPANPGKYLYVESDWRLSSPTHIGVPGSRGRGLPSPAAPSILTPASKIPAHTAAGRPGAGDKAAGLPKHALGARLSHVPANVHERMRALAARGAIPTSTPEQRKRSGGRRPGSEYRVPDALKEALHWGYIGPDLPAPGGFVWRGKAGRWQLAPRGG